MTKLFAVTLSVLVLTQSVMVDIAYGAVIDYGNGIRFDPEYYSQTYADVLAAYGTDVNGMLQHYLTVGIPEGRMAYADQTPEEAAYLKSVLAPAAEAPAVQQADAAALTTDTAALTAAKDLTAAEEEADRKARWLSLPPEPLNPAAPAVPAAAVASPVQTSNGLVLVYLNGTDLESNSGAATRLVNQAINASASGNTRFVIMAGGTQKWQHPLMQSANNGNTVSYVVENGTIRELKQYGTQKEYMSSEMVTTFINDTKALYTSDHTSLVFWDHGGGAAGGYGKNEVSGRKMSASAVAAGVKNSGTVFESVGFDTCLMGSLDVASNFAGTAKYFLGSQENEGNYGWDFNSFSTYGTTDFVTFGKKLINDYDVYTKANDRKESIRTLALYDLNSVNIAQAQWNDLVAKLGESKGGIELMALARDFAREYDDSGTADNRNGQIDLVGFLGTLANTQVGAESAALLNTLKSTVVYKNGNTMDGVSGISIYMPGENTYMYNEKYDDIKANNISDATMKAYDKLASIYIGQRENTLFQQTSYDQNHNERNLNHYKNKKWFDNEYASLGTEITCHYRNVQNGGFAIESETGLTPAMIKSAELRVVLRNDSQGYVSLGRTDTFCTTASKTSPVYNFNGQWLHINGMPVAVYQYDDFVSSRTGDHLIYMYTTAEVNGKDSKIDIAWNATQKKWEYYGYVDIDTNITSKTASKRFMVGDTVRFLYDKTKTGSSDLTATYLFDPITITESGLNLETRLISQPGSEVLFYGTITDTYGKTISTPCFKADPGSQSVTEEQVPGVKPEVTPSKNFAASEKWVFTDDGEDSFLSYYYDPATGTYESYSEDTGAYNMIFETSGDVVHYNETLKVGFYYNDDEGLYYLLDSNGNIDITSAMDEETFVLLFGSDADDFENFDAVIASLDDGDDVSVEGNVYDAGEAPVSTDAGSVSADAYVNDAIVDTGSGYDFGDYDFGDNDSDYGDFDDSDPDDDAFDDDTP